MDEFSEPPIAQEVRLREPKEKLRRIAQKHRDVNVAIFFALGVIVAYFALFLGPYAGYRSYFATWFLLAAVLAAILQAAAALRFASELASDVGLPVLFALLQLIPCVSIVVLGILSFWGHQRLVRNGLKPGMMGVDPKTI
jgi:hypothetical protein